MSDLPPLPSECVSLLGDEKARPEPAADVRARMFERLEASIAALPGDGGGDGGDSGGGGHGGGSPPAPAAPVGLVSSLIAQHPIGAAIALFALGGAFGVAADRAIATPPAPRTEIVTVEKLVSAPVATPAATSIPSVAAPEPSAEPRSAAPLRPSESASPRTPAGSLAAERVLVDLGKTALGRRDYASALDALDRHLQRHPQGQLAEEREALAVQALTGLGRMDEARARGGRFKRAFPQSIFLPVVEAALLQ